MTDGSQPITGLFVKQLYDLQKNEVVKPVRFLTQKHVEPTNFEKMHVGRAVQLFSDDVISALSFLKEYPSRHPQAEKFRSAEVTVLFMKMIKKWYAIHNVANRTAHVHMRQPDQMHFFCATDQHLQGLEKEWEEVSKCGDLRSSFANKQIYGFVCKVSSRERFLLCFDEEPLKRPCGTPLQFSTANGRRQQLPGCKSCDVQPGEDLADWQPLPIPVFKHPERAGCLEVGTHDP